MLADGEEVNVLEDDDIPVVFVEAGPQQVCRVLPDAGEEVSVHAGDAVGRVLESVAVGVFADGAEDGGYGLPDTVFVYQERIPIATSCAGTRWS